MPDLSLPSHAVWGNRVDPGFAMGSMDTNTAVGLRSIFVTEVSK